jgi:hypothetical protein
LKKRLKSNQHHQPPDSRAICHRRNTNRPRINSCSNS